ncbi:MAG: hypothetical protein ACRDST_00310 [Pseudonocardiaceae bacterium]
MSATAHPTTSGLVSRAGSGALAGIAGGIAFGVLMAMMGMLPMVGMLIGVDNPGVGFLVHLVNSVIIGAIFGVLAYGIASKIGPVLGAGVVYGVVWWVLGALLIMPLWLSLTADPMMRDMVFTVGSDQWMSLLGHAIFGLITAAALYGLRRRVHT